LGSFFQIAARRRLRAQSPERSVDQTWSGLL
jgi:hypothetical protein